MIERNDPDGPVSRVLRTAEPRVTLRGSPGELVLFFAGRKDAAVVTLEGTPEAVALVRAARFGT